MAQRLDGYRLGWPDSWQFPQGGIEDSEGLAVAALRELQEETGIVDVKIVAEMPHWLYYDLPENLASSAWQGKYKGQKQKWFLIKFLGNDSQIDLAQTNQIYLEDDNAYCRYWVLDHLKNLQSGKIFQNYPSKNNLTPLKSRIANKTFQTNLLKAITKKGYNISITPNFGKQNEISDLLKLNPRFYKEDLVYWVNDHLSG